MVVKYKAPQLHKVYILEWLNHLKVSQADLARRMGTSPTNISRWATEQERLTIDILSGMADALKLDNAGVLLQPPERYFAQQGIKEMARTIVATDDQAGKPKH